MIVTDHSPCPPAMKSEESGRFDLAWGGIASLSVALSVIHTECRQRGFTLDDIVRWMSSAPAALAGLSNRAGALAAGRDANFILFDSDAEFTVTPDRLHYRHPISPYFNKRLRGIVTATYLRGEAVYREGTFAQTRFGREVTL
jgi:allantoinase